MFSKAGKVFIFLLVFAGAYKFCKKQTQGFQTYMVRSNLSYHPEWEVSHSSEDEQELRAALSQPFHYLAKGAQSFVFESEDGQYILKLFRQDHLRFPVFFKPLRKFPFLKKTIEEKIAIKEEQMQRDFLSYKIAYNSLKEETGLIFVHLNKTSHLGLQVELRDKIGIFHPFDMDETEFLLQRKATLLYEGIDTLLSQKDQKPVKSVIQELVQLLAKRCQMGIFDKDPDLNTNFGLLMGHPVQIDVGRFRINNLEKDPQVYKKEIEHIVDNLRQKLSDADPSLSEYLLSTIEEIPDHDTR